MHILPALDRICFGKAPAIGFSIVLALFFVVGAAALFSQQRAMDAIDKLASDARFAELALQSNNALRKARRFEADFYLQYPLLGFVEAKSRYVTFFSTEIAGIRVNLSTIPGLSGQAKVAPTTRQIEEALGDYERGFLKVVDLYATQPGHERTAQIAESQASYLVAAYTAEASLENLCSSAVRTTEAMGDQVVAVADLTRRTVLIASLLAILIGVVVAWRNSASIARSIQTSMAFASQVAAGNFDTCIAVPRQAEFAALANALNTMAEALRDARAAKESRATELEERVEARTSDLVRVNRSLLGEAAIHTQTELDLQASIEKAELATRVKSEFLANMSHEIRTPMNGVIGLTELMLKTPMSNQQRDFMGMIKSSSDSLLRLLNDILDFSKMEARKLELEQIEFNLRESLGAALKAFAASVSLKGLELASRISPELPVRVIGDPGRLTQIVTNLVGNALKFTEKGEVIVRVEPWTASDGELAIHFAVSDTGVGMTEAQQKNIFEAFAQADKSISRQYGGTGLGLAIVAQLVSLMRGRVWVESEAGAGTTIHFIVTLGLARRQGRPVVHGKAVLQNLMALVVDDNVVAQPVSSDRRKPVRALRVLVADDHPINQRVASEILINEGHDVMTASSGLEVLKIMNHETFDAILMDGQMPDMDGYEATIQIRKRERGTGQRVRIIAVTANVMKHDYELSLAAGMDDYISKPVDSDKLLASLALSERRGDAQRGEKEYSQGFGNSETQPGEPTTMTDSQQAEPIPVVFDAESALQRVRGRRVLLCQMIDLFLQDLPGDLTALHAALQARDAQALEHCAHRLKGAAATMGADALASGAARVAAQAGTRDLTGIEVLVDGLTGDVDALRVELRAFTTAKT